VESKNKSDAYNNKRSGTISKSLKKYPNNMPGKHDMKEL
jgi:hypothetical protein